MTGTWASPLERLLRNSIPEPNSGCWLWLGGLNRQGYGQINMPGNKQQRAHRLSYKIHKGEIPKGLDVRHTCDIRCCINPDHLIVGTKQQNAQDAIERNRYVRGEKRKDSKLTNSQAAAIKADTRSQRIIAAEYGIDPAIVCNIRRGKTWKHV